MSGTGFVSDRGGRFQDINIGSDAKHSDESDRRPAVIDVGLLVKRCNLDARTGFEVFEKVDGAAKCMMHVTLID